MENNSKAECPAPPQVKHELRRDVSVWGSYMWGYADVGADIYVALGLVMAYAQGASSLVFALAGIVYIMIGFAYTELSSAYPVAGGGPYFTLRGLGDFWGFVGGSALLLDYTIDIALFATASAGYLNFFMPYVFGRGVESFVISLGPLHGINPVWCLETLFIIALLIMVNIKGIKESSWMNSIIGAVDLLAEGSIIIFGFLFAWKPEMLAQQWKTQFPSLHNLMYGSSLAIISFVGLESISQAAQETRRPASVIPRTSLTLIFTVFVFAVSFSTMGLGVLPWKVFAEHMGDPVATLAHSIPFIGLIAGPFAAILGATILFISSNTGVMGASRLTYSLSQFGIISPWFHTVHPKFHTPVRTIVIFSMIAVMQTVLSFLTPSAMDTLGNMYAFGASLGYTLVFIALIKLRFSDPYTPRPYKVPLNINFKHKERKVSFPLLGVIGMLGVATILFMVVLTHTIGRIAGPTWIILCFIYYAWYRKKACLPVWKSISHDWENEQIEVLTSAEEYDLLEQYKLALAERDKNRKEMK
jgi:APA family basic amino acid/polyamine antiporter